MSSLNYGAAGSVSYHLRDADERGSVIRPTDFPRIAPDIVNGTCPKALQDFLEVRGLGILNIRELFGAGALRSNKYLRLIIRLERLDRPGLVDIDRLGGTVERITIDDLWQQTFYARITVSLKSGYTQDIDARPSDAIALALRTRSPIYMAESVIESIKDDTETE